VHVLMDGAAIAPRTTSKDLNSECALILTIDEYDGVEPTDS
jgi:hypothetical protein